MKISETIKIKINEFVLESLNSRDNINKKIKIFKVSDKIAKEIKEKTNINVLNYTHVIDKYSIKHTFKNHSNINSELKRGLIPITLKDFERIPDVIKNFDEIKYGGKNKVGRDVIIYVKKLNGFIFYIEEIRSLKKKELVMQTMYVKPKKSSNI